MRERGPCLPRWHRGPGAPCARPLLRARLRSRQRPEFPAWQVLLSDFPHRSHSGMIPPEDNISPPKMAAAVKTVPKKPEGKKLVPAAKEAVEQPARRVARPWDPRCRAAFCKTRNEDGYPCCPICCPPHLAWPGRFEKGSWRFALRSP